MKVRYATLEDSKHISEWRNDEVTRSMSTNADIVEWGEHDEWYKAVLLDPNKVIIVGEDDKGKIGVVRLDYNDERTQAKISINLNPIRRGQKLSSSLLNESICFAKLTNDIRLIAKIKHQNTISIGCFSKCGFDYTSADDDYIYLVKLMQ
jgi:RimJ/RimL family protein N-acetyltransferase